MALATRELSVTYGSETVGATGDKQITSTERKFSYNETATTFAIEFDVLVMGSSESVFHLNCATVEAAFSKPEQAVTLTMHGAARYSFDPAAGTGFRIFPSIDKNGSDMDGGLARLYSVRIEGETPANNWGTSGRREAEFDLKTDPSGRRTVTATGLYTMVSSNTAREQYEAQATSYISGVLNAIDSNATWELVDESAVEEDRNGLLKFTRVYQELIFDQAGATTPPGSDDIKNQSFSITLSDVVSFGDLAGVRLPNATATYSCNVATEVPSGGSALETRDLKAFYTGTIKPFLISQLTSALGAGGAFMLNQDVTIHQDESRIDASLSYASPGANPLFYEKRVTVADTDATGGKAIPVWDGNELSHFLVQGPRTWIRTITETIKLKGFVQGGPFQDMPGLVDPDGRTSVLIDQSSRYSVVQHRSPPVAMTEAERITVIQFINEPGFDEIPTGARLEEVRGFTIPNPSSAPVVA